MTAVSELVGTWRLESYQELDSAGEIVDEPFGHAPVGKLVYTGDGHMSVILMRAEQAALRVPFPRYATIEQKTSTVDGCLGYSGTYRIEDKVIVHHVEVSSFPDWVGLEQRRVMELDHGKLVLRSTPYVWCGEVRTPVLTWFRY
ncbi:lipocalin-like domain-containing protein [Saccharopolyspora shandongensis]|uniref:lipocalin-like domain-containing protein n=1 Tax=Saccharopolyspora shandongensis TaxID=418495 RepID=UPI0033DCA85A